MALIQSKQISKLQIAPVRVSGFTGVGASTVITSAVTTALSTAGDGGVSVPLQITTSTAIGVVTTGTNNRVEIYNATTKDKIKSTNGDEVYGRITESAGVYTLTYYTLVNGVETAYTLASTSIDFEFNYKFDFYRFPSDAVIGITSRNVSQDVRSTATLYTELLTATAQNTLPNLTKLPNVTYNVTLIVNNSTYTTLGGGSADFTVTTKTIAWSAANAGFNIETTDRIIAQYTTNE